MFCKKCIMPKESPLVKLDSSGVCQYCKSYTPFNCKGEKALQETLNLCRNPDGDYDCIVNISGGRDIVAMLF